MNLLPPVYTPIQDQTRSLSLSGQCSNQQPVGFLRTKSVKQTPRPPDGWGLGSGGAITAARLMHHFPVAILGARGTCLLAFSAVHSPVSTRIVLHTSWVWVCCISEHEDDMAREVSGAWARPSFSL